MTRRSFLHKFFLTISCLISPFIGAMAAPITVEVTAYAESGNRTASGRFPTRGMIAVSRDLERTYKLRFGDRIHLHGLGTYTFHDRMHHRWTHRCDIYLVTVDEARKFGIRRTTFHVSTT